jgi:iron complex outermembrane receptor protein
MKKIMIFILVILYYLEISAQNQIHGIISDLNGAPLAGANIFVPESQKGTVADTNGWYRLTNLGNGKLKVQFSFLGFTSRIETIDLNNSPIELNVVLEPSPIETEGIVVSGGYNSTQHENAVKIDILRLNNLNISGSPNFTEILTKIPGVDMISKGPGVSKPVIRGLSMNDILVLNNGVRFENYQYSDHHPLGISESGVDDIEIIKGPASLLYGSDAIGGVINFLKEKPAPVGQIAGDYHLQLFSNTMGIQNDFGIKGASKNFYGGLRVAASSHSDFLEGGGRFVPNSRFNEQSLSSNTGYSNKFGTFKLFYDYNDQMPGLSEEEAVVEVTERDRKNEVWYQQFRNHLISSQNKIFAGNYKVEVNAAYQNTTLIHFGEKDVTEIEMALGTFTYEARLHFPSGKNSEYIIGFQGLNQNNKNLHNRETKLLPDATTDNYSLMGLLQYTFFGKLRTQAGMRYDFKSIETLAAGLPENEDYRASLNREYGSFSGSAGATYNLSDDLLFRSNFSAAYRTPNLAELTSNGMHETRYELGNPDLIPQNAYETDVSVHYHTHYITIDLALFYNKIDNYIFIAPTSDTTLSGDEIFKYLQSDALLYGGEAGFHLHPRPIEWLHFETTFASVTGERDNGDNLPFIPSGKLNFELRAEKGKLAFFRNTFIRISSSSAFDQNHPSTEEERTPGYSLFNAGIGAGFKVAKQLVSFGFSVNNIFDTKYIDHLSTLREVGYFNPGRNISLNLKIPFGIKNEGLN